MFASRLSAPLRVFRGEHPEISYEAVYLAALLWLPLVAIGMIERTVNHRIEPILQDLAVHARLLIAVPILPFVYALVAKRQEQTLGRIVEEELTPHPASATRLARWLDHWSDAPGVQVALLVTAVAVAQLLFWGAISTSGIAGGAKLERVPRGPAGVWYAWIALPIFYFFVLRVLWRWALWIRVLARLSRLPLRGVATHPDRAGGIAFLTLPSAALSLFALVTGAVIAASWGTEVMLHGVSVMKFRDPLAIWVLLIVLLSFGPLLSFMPQLMRLRREGVRDYGRLALIYSRRFRERWIHPDPTSVLLGSSDIQSLNDMGGSFGYVERIRLVPFGAREVVLTAVLVLVPMIPLMLSVVPFSKLVVSFAHALM